MTDRRTRGRRRLMWFRSDLRVRDNTALEHAARRGADQVEAVFVTCAGQWRRHDWGPRKIDFVLRNASALGESLAERGIPLHLLQADSFAEVPGHLLRLARRLGSDVLHYNREYEVNEVARDEAVERDFRAAGVAVCPFHDQTILPPDALRTGGNTFYTVFTPYRRAWLKRLQEAGIPRVLPRPRRQHDERVRFGAAGLPVPWRSAPAGADRLWPAGEAEAQRRLRRFVNGHIDAYGNARDFPALNGTSALSPYLACGAISPRQCLAAATAADGQRLQAGRAGPTAWITELIWREFYRHVLVGFPRVCRNRAFKVQTDRIRWRRDEDDFGSWCAGRTGVPIVDAAMRQLLETGWMHNRLRMVVAMYLTKDLFIDWRQGERFFMTHLVDGDFASNNGGWQWAASTGTDAAPYFRIFNPISQSRRFDPDGTFIHRYCPELADLGGRAIHDPAALPPPARGAIDYPDPIVDHTRARARVMAAFREPGRQERA